MRVRFTVVLMLGMAVSAITGYGQQIKMWLDSVDYDQDNPFNFNGTDTVITYLHATDSLNIPIGVTGNVAYWVRSDSMIQAGIDPVLVDNDASYENVPLGGLTDSLLIPLNNLTLRTGPGNVIIIWPVLINPAHTLIDSGFTTITVYISETAGMENSQGTFGSTVFPNPSQGIPLLHVQSKHTQPIAHIDIVNMLGQPIYSKAYTEYEQNAGYLLPLGGFDTGVYYVHIYYTDGKHETIKFIRN